MKTKRCYTQHTHCIGNTCDRVKQHEYKPIGTGECWKCGESYLSHLQIFEGK